MPNVINTSDDCHKSKGPARRPILAISPRLPDPKLLVLLFNDFLSLNRIIVRYVADLTNHPVIADNQESSSKRALGAIFF